MWACDHFCWEAGIDCLELLAHFNQAVFADSPVLGVVGVSVCQSVRSAIAVGFERHADLLVDLSASEASVARGLVHDEGILDIVAGVRHDSDGGVLSSG